MCLLIFAHRVSASRPLVVAANRDEFHARPTAVSEFWPKHPELLAGRDLEQGGTWMGLTRHGRFAALTNYRDPATTAPAPRSRGELPLRYLTGTQDPATYLEQLASGAGEYAGFSLLLGDGHDLWYYSNNQPSGEPRGQALAPGIYGLSNALLDTPWPKVTRGKEKLRQLMDGESPPDHTALLDVVGSRTLADSAALHRQGLGSEMEQLLSAQFIVTDRYGTRSGTTMWIDNEGHASWRELSYDAAGKTSACSDQAFELMP